MFVQVIKGRTNDPAGFQQQLDRWYTELKPGAAGYLGGTSGIADDGTCFGLVRFADEAAARTNSDRPEQGAWWQETAKFYVSEPTFRESSDVTTLFGGGSDDAGFVQVMEGKVHDRARTEALETEEMLAQLRAARPDLMGSVRAWFADGEFVEFAYFTTEAEARSGETSAEFSTPQEEYIKLFGEMTFTDLRDPILD